MTKFWHLTWLDEHVETVAFGSDDPERDRLLSDPDEIQDWSAPRLEVALEELVDFVPNNLGVRLCSLRLRDLIDGSLGPEDRVQWLPAEVLDIHGTSYDYVVLHLPGDGNVVDESRSIMVGDFVVKAVIDGQKVKGRQVFRLPEEMLTMFVSDDLKRRMESASITGVHFDAALLSNP